VATIEDLRQWIGKDALDRGNEKVGKLVDVYYDVDSDHSLFLVVDTGRRKPSLLVPAWNAVTTPDHITVAYDPDALSIAPTVDLSVGLTVEEEARLFSFYGVEYKPSHSASGRRLMRR
jgi:PRC-barrel domain